MWASAAQRCNNMECFFMCASCGIFLFAFFLNNTVFGTWDAYQRLEVGCSSKMLIEHFLWQQINNVHVWTDQIFRAVPERSRALTGCGLKHFLIQDVFPKGDCTCSDLTWPQLGFPDYSFSKEMLPGCVSCCAPVSCSSVQPGSGDKARKATLPVTAAPKCFSGTWGEPDLGTASKCCSSVSGIFCTFGSEWWRSQLAFNTGK